VTRISVFFGILMVLGCAGWYLVKVPNAQAKRLAQIPTGSIATVTGSPVTAIVIVLDSVEGFANVRSGPGTLGYEIVGVLLEGQQVPGLGRTVVGNWILISYPGAAGGVGWINKDLVEVQGSLPIVDVPPTITPQTTPTLDPTLAAQFLVDIPPTKLPTFTAPPPLTIPTFTEAGATGISSRIPIGFVIVGMAILGIFGIIISFLRGR
jgi:hypothetical protein